MLGGSFSFTGLPDRAPILQRPGLLMGEAVTLYRIPMRRFHSNARDFDGGDLILVQFGQCIEPVTRDQRSEIRMAGSDETAAVAIGFYSAEGLDGFNPGTAFDAVMTGLEITLPSHLTPCPADLGAALEALDAPHPLDDGRMLWSIFGLHLALPSALQLNWIDELAAQFHAEGFPAGGRTELNLFTDSRDFDFARDMIERDTAEGDLRSAQLELEGLGQARLTVAEIGDDASHRSIAHLLALDSPAAVAGLRILTQVSDSPDFDAAAIQAMQRAVIDALEPASAGFILDPLPLGMPGQASQRDQAQDITPITHDLGEGLILRAGLPPGWEALELTNSLSLLREVAPRQLIMAALSYAAPLQPDDCAGTINRETTMVGGQPATLFHARSAAPSLGYLGNPQGGALTLAILDQCVGTGRDARPVTVILYTEAGHAPPGQAPAIAAILDGLALDLPEGFAIQPGPPYTLSAVLFDAEAGANFELAAELLPFHLAPEDLAADFAEGHVQAAGKLRLADGKDYARFDIRFTDPDGMPMGGVVLVATEAHDGWHHLHVALLHRADAPDLAALAAAILAGLEAAP